MLVPVLPPPSEYVIGEAFIDVVAPAPPGCTVGLGLEGFCVPAAVAPPPEPPLPVFISEDPPGLP